ncbi:MAG TPA: hypothetical protein VD907_06825 [Verrucomicrobiae bacterium]|nr:hypothetical protein [Verrucomicrobiae bacterium]
MRYEFNGVTENGTLRIINRRLFDECIHSFNGKPVTITLERKKKKRSSPQNRFFHGPVLDILQAGLIDAGFNEARSKDWVKDLIKYKFLKYETISEHGEPIEAIKHTSELTTSEFMDFVADVTQWAAEFLGIEIPDPGQVELTF